MFSIKDTEILLRGLLSYCMPQNSERYDPTLLYKLVSTLMHKEKLASRLNARAQAPVLANLADANIHAAFKAVDVLFESFQHNPAEQKKCLNACLSCYMLLLEGDLRGNRGQLAHYLLNTASKVTGVRLSWLVGRDRKGNPVLIIEPENPGAPTAFARPVYVEGKIKNIEYIGCKFKIGSSMLAAWSSKHYALGSEAFLHTLDLINAVETTFLRRPEKLGPLKKRLQPINDVISDYLAAPDRHKALVPVRPEEQTGNGGPLPDARQNSFYINKLLI